MYLFWLRDVNVVLFARESWIFSGVILRRMSQLARDVVCSLSCSFEFGMALNWTQGWQCLAGDSALMVFSFLFPLNLYAVFRSR